MSDVEVPPGPPQVEEVRVQVVFGDDSGYRDALNFTADEHAALSDEEIGAMIAERTEAWYAEQAKTAEQVRREALAAERDELRVQAERTAARIAVIDSELSLAGKSVEELLPRVES